jgi:hypothetical protein
MVKKRKQKKERPEATRPFPRPVFPNFDYTEEGPNETSPGGGLYHGKMDKYKSVKEFVTKRRKQLRKRREQLERAASIFYKASNGHS